MLIEFYGKECPHCQKMEPLVESFEKKTGLNIEKHEVWHDEKNLKELQKYDNGLCGGIPFFFNTDTKAFLCGEVAYEDIENWAKGAIRKKNQ